MKGNVLLLQPGTSSVYRGLVSTAMCNTPCSTFSVTPLPCSMILTNRFLFAFYFITFCLQGDFCSCSPTRYKTTGMCSHMFLLQCRYAIILESAVFWHLSHLVCQRCVEAEWGLRHECVCMCVVYVNMMGRLHMNKKNKIHINQKQIMANRRIKAPWALRWLPALRTFENSHLAQELHFHPETAQVQQPRKFSVFLSFSLLFFPAPSFLLQIMNWLK